MSNCDITIRARDGYSLAASVIGGAGRGAVIVNSATGVRRQFYRRFSEYLAGQGSAIVTYDYRGIGDSGADKTPNGLKARMRDWALLDAYSVLEWTADRYLGKKITVIGHSFGGQCLGLLENYERIDRIVLVGAQSGYWGHFAGFRKFRLWLLWYAGFPALTRLLGYFPGKRLGLGEDLPAGVALEWARWCRQRHYLMDDLGPELPSYFESLKAPILAYKISDDSYAPDGAVDALLDYYRAAPVKVRSVSPGDCGVKGIGHFGLFREPLKETLWAEIAAWVATAN
jgi:predicted alpha/beta hydrolase